ncbi:hypothetical protein SELMODRAFT_414342 [Selaginella moellendorffii]|uniref:Uncharacterized protein n=1 Tax=Selaginella moellendorffii TaxID=88036 RepID=D8RSF1_SELML|nr:hypothetical protein SELMODRAFT_414342 [Selaginella moellendorffii]
MATGVRAMATAMRGLEAAMRAMAINRLSRSSAVYPHTPRQPGIKFIRTSLYCLAVVALLIAMLSITLQEREEEEKPFRVLVIGASGFLGYKLSLGLLANTRPKIEVVGIDAERNERAQLLESAGMHILYGNVTKWALATSGVKLARPHAIVDFTQQEHPWCLPLNQLTLGTILDAATADSLRRVWTNRLPVLQIRGGYHQWPGRQNYIYIDDAVAVMIKMILDFTHVVGAVTVVDIGTPTPALSFKDVIRVVAKISGKKQNSSRLRMQIHRRGSLEWRVSSTGTSRRRPLISLWQEVCHVEESNVNDVGNDLFELSRLFAIASPEKHQDMCDDVEDTSFLTSTTSSRGPAPRNAREAWVFKK